MDTLEDVMKYLSHFPHQATYRPLRWARTGSLVADSIKISFDQLKPISDAGFIVHIFPEKNGTYSLDIDNDETILNKEA